MFGINQLEGEAGVGIGSPKGLWRACSRNWLPVGVGNAHGRAGSC